MRYVKTYLELIYEKAEKYSFNWSGPRWETKELVQKHKTVTTAVNVNKLIFKQFITFINGLQFQTDFKSWPK